jgi:Right handed beta helix region
VDIEASYTTFTRLRIDGSNTLYPSHPDGVDCPGHVSQGLVIAGPGDVLDHIDYFQSIPRLRGNGIGIGWWGHPDHAIVRYSLIHDIGQCMAYDHLIYLAGGNNVQIYDNWIWNDLHGRGVQLYPGPSNARVYGNVIDHVGEGLVIGNDPGYTVSGNQIFHNIVSDCVGLPWEAIPGQAIHALYGGAAGTDNSFHDNLLFRDPGGVGPPSGLIAYGNFTANPRFVNASAHNFATRSHSGLVRWLRWAGPPGP